MPGRSVFCLCLLYFLRSNGSGYVKKPDLPVFVSGKRSVICIKTMSRYQNILRYDRKSHLYDDRRMPEYLSLERQLNQIPRPQVFHCTRFPYRPDRDAPPRQEIIEVRYSRPGWGFLIRIDIVPAKRRRKIHDPTSRKNTLGCKIGTVTTQILIIIIRRISTVRPLMGISDNRSPVIILYKTHGFSPLLSYARPENLFRRRGKKRRDATASLLRWIKIRPFHRNPEH